MGEKELKKKQNRKLTIFACLLSVLSIGLLIFGFFAVSSDKVVMLQSVSNLTRKLENYVDEEKEILNKIASSNEVGLRANITATINKYILETNNSISLKYDYLENKKEQKTKMDFQVNMGDTSLLSGNFMLADEKAHYYLDDLTPRYYNTAFDYFSAFPEISGDSLNELTSMLKESINESIGDDDIKKEKATIKYNGKDKKVNKLTYTITEKEAYDMVRTFIESLEKNKKLISSLSNLLKIDEKELESSLQEFLKDEQDLGTEEALYYNVYYYGFNKIVQYELEDRSGEVKLQYKTGKTEEINIIINGEKIISVEITKNKKQYDFKITVVDDANNTYAITGTKSDNQYSFVIPTEAGDVKFIITREKTDSIYKEKYNFKVSVLGMNMITIDMDSEVYFDEKIDVSLEDSVDINEISEDDQETIMNNLMNHPLYQIYEMIEGMDMENFDIGL